MRGTRTILGVVLGFSLLGSQTPASQAPRPTPSSPQLTFRTTTSLVEVDVVIHDKKGDFVPGLTADDLELFEDGQRQQIDQFYMVSHERGGQPFPVTGDQPALPEDRARRVFVMMFDDGHLAPESLMRTKAGVAQFIKENLGPGDFGGIFHNGQMYNGRLTTSHAELQAGLSRVTVGFEHRQALLATFREFPRIPGEIDAMRIAEGSIEVARRIGARVCQDDPQSCQLNGGLNQVENLIQQKARLYVRQARILTSNTLESLRYVISRLSRIPGRKTLVFLSEGFFMEDARDDLVADARQVGADDQRR